MFLVLAVNCGVIIAGYVDDTEQDLFDNIDEIILYFYIGEVLI